MTEYEVTAIGPNGYIDFNVSSQNEAISIAEFLLDANDSVDVSINQRKE